MTSIKKSPNYWMCYQKSTEENSYNDVLGQNYNYDSNVPNFKQVASGDIVVIRIGDSISGYGIISDIQEFMGMKTIQRCPLCERTSINMRKHKKPKYKCKDCKHEFDNAKENEVKVKKFSAIISSFKKLSKHISSEQVKTCSTRSGQHCQNSIINLDETKIKTLLPEIRQLHKSESPTSAISDLNLCSNDILPIIGSIQVRGRSPISRSIRNRSM